MLVIQLDDKEAITIGSHITLRFCWKNGKPKIGIEAPRELDIRRVKVKQGPQNCEVEDDLRPAPETVVPPRKGDVL